MTKSKTRVHELILGVGAMGWKQGKQGPELSLHLEYEGERLDKVAAAFGNIGAELLGVTIEPVLDDDDGTVVSLGAQRTPTPAQLEPWSGVGYLAARTLAPPRATATLRVIETDEASVGRIRSLLQLRVAMAAQNVKAARVKLQLYQEGLFDQVDADELEEVGV